VCRGTGCVSILENGIVRFLERVVRVVPFFLYIVPPSVEPELPYAKHNDTDDCDTSNDTANNGTDVWSAIVGDAGGSLGSGKASLNTGGSGAGIAVAEGLVADLVGLALRTAGGDVGALNASFEEGESGGESEGYCHC
jgi:hypothetical protein